VTEIEHLIEHDVGQSFNPCDAVADLADGSNVLPNGGCLRACDALFDFL
jgi:hypothetical protein